MLVSWENNFIWHLFPQFNLTIEQFAYWISLSLFLLLSRNVIHQHLNVVAKLIANTDTIKFWMCKTIEIKVSIFFFRLPSRNIITHLWRNRFGCDKQSKLVSQLFYFFYIVFRAAPRKSWTRNLRLIYIQIESMSSSDAINTHRLPIHGGKSNVFCTWADQ